MDERIPRIFLLQLVPTGRFGGLIAAVGIFLALGATFWAGGALSTDDAPIGVTLFFMAIHAYVVPMLAWVALRAEYCRDRLLDIMPSESEYRDIRFDSRPWAWQSVSIVIGLLGGSLHLGLLVLEDNLTFTPENHVTEIIVVATYLTWIVISVFVGALFGMAQTFRDIAAEVQIDLLHVDQLTPFASIAIGFALTMIGAQTVNTLMFIQGYTLAAFLPGWLGLFVPMIGLMFIPIWPVHKAIVAEKARELARINEAIDTARDAAGDPRSNAEKLSSLLSYRREIAETREWPFDLGFYSRFAIYLLIPPITWVGAALIEQVVDSFL